MPLQNDAFHTQTKVDVTRLKDAIVNAAKAAVVSFDGTGKLVTELVNKLAVEPYVECTRGGSKLIFVFRKNMTKRCFKKEMS